MVVSPTWRQARHLDGWRRPRSDPETRRDPREGGAQHPPAREAKGETMRLSGRVYRDGKLWLVEIPILDAMTQSRTRKEAYAIAADLVESLVNRPGFKVLVYPTRNGDFEVGVSDTKYLVALVLRRQRQASGLSLAQVARRLGARSRNAYARYEQAAAVPTVERFFELLAAVSNGRAYILGRSSAA